MLLAENAIALLQYAKNIFTLIDFNLKIIISMGVQLLIRFACHVGILEKTTDFVFS
jgi:hypothetical protein